MKKIPILCSVDQDFKLIFDTFTLVSFHKYNLSENFDLLENKLKSHRSDDFGYCSRSYIRFRIEHLQNLVDFLTKNPEHEYIISIDSDSLFLGGFKDRIHSIIENYQDIPIFLCRENDEDPGMPNVGLMILKNCNDTIDFLRSMISILENNTSCKNFYNILKDIIINQKIKIYLLDNKQFINNSVPRILRDKRLLYSDACFFHATSTKNIYHKVSILSDIMIMLNHTNVTYRSYDDHSKDTTIVLAKYNENLGWIDSLYQKHSLVIYDKCPNESLKENTRYSKLLPNVGKNSHTYLTHIVNNYNSLTEYTYFLQGNPFNHFNRDILEKFGNLTLFNTYCNENNGFFCMSSLRNESSVQKLPINYFMNKIFDIKNSDINEDNLILCSSSNFVVHKDNILCRSKSFYKKLLKIIDHDSDPIEHYIFEKIWYYIFNSRFILNPNIHDFIIG